MNTQIYHIKGMHCASCSSLIEKTLKKVEGVQKVEANFGTETAKISFDELKISPETLSKKIEPLGYSFIIPETSDHQNHVMPSAKEMGMSEDEHKAHTGIGQSKKEKLMEVADMRSKLFSVIPLAVFSIFLMTWDTLTQFNLVVMMPYIWKEFFHHLLPIFATYTLFVVGKPYLLGFWRFLRYGKANMDSLIGIGTSAAFLYSFVVTAFEEPLRPFLNVDHTYYDVTIVVITFITLGKYLEAQAKIKTGDAIEKLLNLQAKTAIIIKDGKEQEISVNEVVHGDYIVIKPGAKIPVDGILIEGSSFVDESMITGESMPVEKSIGFSVVSGTMNTSGSFIFKATKVGSETLLANIIKMVEDAQGSRAPIQALADKISAVFVPIVMIIAFLSLFVWLLVGTNYLGFAQALSYGLVSFVGVLVIACPCALGLATPTAIIVGVGKGAKEGILIKDAGTLEKLHKVNTIVVDKTGTITKGKPELITISDESILGILASLENKSEHPIAYAIVEYAKKKNIKLFVFCVLVFLALYGNRNHLRINDIRNYDLNFLQTYSGVATGWNEHLPIWIKDTPHEFPSAKLEVLSGNCQMKPLTLKSNLQEFTLTCPKDSQLQLNTAYYPGWQIKVDRQNITALVIDNLDLSNGMMRINLPAGQHQLLAKFIDTPLRFWSKLISLLTLISLIIFYNKQRLFLHQRKI